MPSSIGAWPRSGRSESIRLPKDDPGYWNWPACGEIDIVELWANQSNRVASCLHTSKDATREKGPHAVIGGGDLQLKPEEAPWNGFHTYTLDWDEDNVYMYYDGRQYGRGKLSRGDWPDGQNPFRKPHYLILNLARATATRHREVRLPDGIQSRLRALLSEARLIRVFRSSLTSSEASRSGR